MKTEPVEQGSCLLVLACSLHSRQEVAHLLNRAFSPLPPFLNRGSPDLSGLSRGGDLP